MSYRLLIGDCREQLRELPTGSVQTCVSSPPYWNLRDYGTAGQIGLEPIPDCLAWARQEPPCGNCFVCEMRSVYGAELRRVLKDDGTVWVNLGDSYANDTKWGGVTSGKHTKGLHGTTGIGRNRHKTGLPSKSLIGVPWRVALALQADGWILRQDIIWHKPNPMPESITSRCTKAHEYIFLLSKQPKYYFNHEAIQEPVAESQVGRVRADRVGGTSHKERGQHSIGGVYTGGKLPKAPGNQSHKHVAGYEAGNEQSRLKSGLLAFSDKKENERAQLVRARELAVEHNLTDAHIAAIRACGITDAGKSQQTQDGHGHNTDEVQRLAAEAKAALGGYYREFLLAETRNKRSVWTVATQPYKGAHFAVFPPALITPCILAGSRPGDTVLDLFNGSGTTGEVALTHGREYIGIDLSEEYAKLTHKRLAKVQTSFISRLQKGAVAA